MTANSNPFKTSTPYGAYLTTLVSIEDVPDVVVKALNVCPSFRISDDRSGSGYIILSFAQLTDDQVKKLNLLLKLKAKPS